MASTEATFTLPAEVVGSLVIGRATCHKLGKRSLLLFKAPDGSVKVAPNTCAHMAQALVPDVEDAAAFTCNLHGAKLDASTMMYISGPKFMGTVGAKVEKGTPQPVYDVTLHPDGSATAFVPEVLRSKPGGCSIS
jgi:nitrite reductase/ring-hydroxylating ferredoxin subunit